MNKIETHKLMTYLYADFDKVITPALREVWHDQLENIDYKQAFQAARILVGRKNYGAPKIGDLLEVIREFSFWESTPTWGEAFDDWVKIAKRFGAYQIPEALKSYQEQHPLGFQALGSMAQEYFDLETKNLPTFRAQFRQKYDVLEKRGADQVKNQIGAAAEAVAVLSTSNGHSEAVAEILNRVLPGGEND